MISGTTKAAQPQRLYLNNNAKPADVTYADVLCYHVDACRARITNTEAHEAINALIASLFGVKADDALYVRPADAHGRYDNIVVHKWEINVDTLCHDLATFKTLAVEARAELLEANATHMRYAHLEELAADGVAPMLDETLRALGFESIEEACRISFSEVDNIQQDLIMIEDCVRDAQEWMGIFKEFDLSLRSTALALGYADALDTRDKPRIATVYSLPLLAGGEVVAPLEVQAVLQDIFSMSFGIGKPELVARKYCLVGHLTLNSDDFIEYGRLHVPDHPLK